MSGSPISPDFEETRSSQIAILINATRSTIGTGIGLFVAKQLVEGHGGQIEIESDTNPENHGTTVRVFLPISST